MLVVRFNVDGLRQRINFVTDKSADLGPVLKAFGKYLRAKAQKKFEAEGPGWQPLAKSTVEKLAHTLTGRITVAGKVRKGSQRAVYRKIATELKGGKSARIAKKELDKITRRNAVGNHTATAFLGALQGVSLRSKTLARLERDVLRHSKKTAKQKRAGKRKIEKHRILGKLASSLRASVRRNYLVVESAVDWAGVHNSGGIAGHGAHIPKRTFLELDDDDVLILREMLKAYYLQAFKGEEPISEE